MKKDNNVKISVLLCIITICWMYLIYFLSSQNGDQTAQTSSGIAKILADLIYLEPTESQINNMHIAIRKLAHICLFFVLGTLNFLSISSLIRQTTKNIKYITLLCAMLTTSAYGFFDEWHKQFIAGRHFDLRETLLNIICGIFGVILSSLIYKNLKKKKAL